MSYPRRMKKRKLHQEIYNIKNITFIKWKRISHHSMALVPFFFSQIW